MTEVLIEWSLNNDILKELLENQDSKRDNKIGRLISLALLSLLLALRLLSLESETKLRPENGEFDLFSKFADGFVF